MPSATEFGGSLTFEALKSFSCIPSKIFLYKQSILLIGSCIRLRIMGDGMERLAVMPFPFGCVSHSSISVKLQNPKKAKSELCRNLRGEEYIRIEQMDSISLLPLPKAAISAGLQRLIRSIKSLSQLFVEKEEFVEMKIGLPTDVKHVAHIGLDGSTTTMKSWEMLQGPELLPLPSISLQNFELAMAAQAFADRRMDIN